MLRFYLVPVETSANGGLRGPKYFAYRGDIDPPALVTANLEKHDYGLQPLMLVAGDISDPDDAALAAMPDVVKFNDNLDDQLGVRLAEIQNALETMNLPGSLLTLATTYRQVARGVIGIFAIAGCMAVSGFDIFGGGVTLNTAFNALPLAARTALQNCATRLGYDTSGVTGATTIRQLLRIISNQAAPTPVMGVIL